MIALAIGAFLASAAPAVSGSAPAVAALQLALWKHGFYRGPLDGIRGPLTRKATRRFQRRVGLQVDGIAGPRTRSKLGRYGRPLLGKRIIRRGMVGFDVAEVQFLLLRKGAFVAIDGRFGRLTVAAVRGVQQRASLAPDGLIGLKTLAVLRTERQTRRIIDAAGIRTTIDVWALRYGVDAKLARALVWMESGFHPNLTSPTGAWGLFQIEPSTWAYVETVLARRRFKRTVTGNIHVGVLYLRHLLREFRGNERLALAAWYTGPRHVHRHGISGSARVFVDDVLAIQARI